jgi:hypothetical protein
MFKVAPNFKRRLHLRHLHRFMSFLFTFSLPHLPFSNPFSTQNQEQHDASGRQWRSGEYDDGNEAEMHGSTFMDLYQYKNSRNSRVEPNYSAYHSQAQVVDTLVDNPRKRKKADDNYQVSRDYAPQRSSRRHPRVRQSRNTSGYRTTRDVQFEYHNIPGKFRAFLVPCNHRDIERISAGPCTWI